MIHHHHQPAPPPPAPDSAHQYHHAQQHPYDEMYDARYSPSQQQQHQPLRHSTHRTHYHTPHEGINSPPSYYPIPPPPPAPAPASASLASDASHHYNPSQQMMAPPPPAPAVTMHPHHVHANGYYPNTAAPPPPQPYMTHYPPPQPSPAAAPHISTSPITGNSYGDPRDHFVQRPHDGIPPPPFHPLDYQRVFVYEANIPAMPQQMDNRYNQMGNTYKQANNKIGYPTHSSNGIGHHRAFVNAAAATLGGAAAAAAARKTSISDPRAVTLSDQQPTYVGHIKSANDAILLLSACDLKWPPSSSSSKNGSPSSTRVAATQNASMAPPRRVTRRLLDSERADLVSSGSVFVWDEKEAGMKRWTDGRVWSASRVSGCFLTYRELETRKKVGNSSSNEGPCSNQYKAEGLIKQSFSITTTSGRKLHVISYFTKRDVRQGRLRRVSEDPRFVGEGGGEWGLKIDDNEYSFPDMSQLARPAGVEGEQMNGSAQLNRGDDECSAFSDDSERRSASPHPQHLFEVGDPLVEQGSTPLIHTDMNQNSRKRSFPEESMTEAYRAPTRPRLARLRSSSMSGLQTFRDDVNNPSPFNSSSHSSLATTIPSESDVGASSTTKRKEGNHAKSIRVTTTNHSRSKSSAIRALVSPTLPKESALRQSACDMKPTQSQDCANAVGALLSLAGSSDNNSTDSSTTKSNSNNTARGTSSTPTPSPSSPNGKNQASSSTDGNDVPPKRREHDRAALNKFSLRL